MKCENVKKNQCFLDIKKVTTHQLFPALIMCFAATSAQSEIYQPMSPETDVEYEATYLTIDDSGLIKTMSINTTELSCENPPSRSDLQGAKVQTIAQVITGDVAVNLGFGSFANVSADIDKKYYYFESYKGETCLAPDGKTRITYGYAFRYIIKAHSTNIKADANIAFLAADATINNTSSSVYAMIVGLENETLENLVQELSASDFSLDVENYSKVMNKLSEMNEAFASTPNENIFLRRLGWLTPLSSNDLITAVDRSYALVSIENGKSCKNAIKSVYEDDSRKSVIKVYNNLLGSQACDEDTKPTKTQKDSARVLLRGLID